MKLTVQKTVLVVIVFKLQYGFINFLVILYFPSQLVSHHYYTDKSINYPCLAYCNYNLSYIKNYSVLVVLREKSCPFFRSYIVVIFIVYYCIVTHSVFRYVLFSLVITLFFFITFYFNFHNKKSAHGTWTDSNVYMRPQWIAKIICGPYIYYIYL